MKKVPAPKVVTTSAAIESPLPPQIQEALGELVGAAREGLLALSVGVGLGVVHELMELEVDEVVGPKGKWNPDRAAKRHGHEDGSMTLGGRRVKVNRPRVRTVNDEHELPVATFEYFAPQSGAATDRRASGWLNGWSATVDVWGDKVWPLRLGPSDSRYRGTLRDLVPRLAAHPGPASPRARPARVRRALQPRAPTPSARAARPSALATGGCVRAATPDCCQPTRPAWRARP